MRILRIIIIILLLVAKSNSAEILWETKLENSRHDIITDCTITSDSSLVISFYSYCDTNVFLILYKLDNNGNLIWQNTVISERKTPEKLTFENRWAFNFKIIENETQELVIVHEYTQNGKTIEQIILDKNGNIKEKYVLNNENKNYYKMLKWNNQLLLYKKIAANKLEFSEIHDSSIIVIGTIIFDDTLDYGYGFNVNCDDLLIHIWDTSNRNTFSVTLYKINSNFKAEYLKHFENQEIDSMSSLNIDCSLSMYILNFNEAPYDNCLIKMTDKIEWQVKPLEENEQIIYTSPVIFDKYFLFSSRPWPEYSALFPLNLYVLDKDGNIYDKYIWKDEFSDINIFNVILETPDNNIILITKSIGIDTGLYIAKLHLNGELSSETENSGNNLFVNPNPCTNAISISFITENLNNQVELFITDLYGKKEKILYRQVPAGTFDIDFDLEDFCNGIYFIQMIQNGNITTKPFIKCK